VSAISPARPAIRTARAPLRTLNFDDVRFLRATGTLAEERGPCEMIFRPNDSAFVVVQDSACGLCRFTRLTPSTDAIPIARPMARLAKGINRSRSTRKLKGSSATSLCLSPCFRPGTPARIAPAPIVPLIDRRNKMALVMFAYPYARPSRQADFCGVGSVSGRQA
jgi:hypothetical protein